VGSSSLPPTLVLSRWPDWNYGASLAEIAVNFHARGVPSTVGCVWPDQQPLEARPSTCLAPLLPDPLPLRPSHGAPNGRRYWRDAPNPVNGWRAPCLGGVAAASAPVVPGRPIRRLCFLSATGAYLRPLEQRAVRQPVARIPARPVPTHIYGVLHVRESCLAVATSVVVDLARFSWWERLPGLAAWCVDWLGPSLQQQSARGGSPRRHGLTLLQGRDQRLKGFTPRNGVSPPRAQRSSCVQ